jgi:peptidoglycan/LPS O-acetylase OafA/YrhL
MGGVDLLRAIAVSSVFFFHFQWFQPGWLGVDLFFVLSGFLIGGAIIDQAQRGTWSYRRFYLHRAMRILPVYYLFILLKSALVGLPLADHSPAFSLASVGAAMSFMQTSSIWYFGWMADAKFVPGGTWSLVIEEYFYLLCPVLLVTVWSIYRSHRALMTALLLACVSAPIVRYLSNYHYAPDDKDWYFASWLQFRSRYDTLVFGVIAALIVRKWDFSLRQRAIAFSAGAAILAGVLGYLVNSRMWLHSGQTTRLAAQWFPFLLGAAFALILAAIHKMRCRAVFIAVIARLSFVIYLGHIFLQELYGSYSGSSILLVQQLKSMTSAEGTLVFGVATLALSYLVSLLVEYPFIRLYRKPAAPIEEAAESSIITERGVLE